MKSLVSILLGLLCLILFTESRVVGQSLVPSKESAMRSTTDGPSLGALKRCFPSAIQLPRLTMPSDSALPSGTYTVGLTGRFPTIDSAFNKLNRDGVLGPVSLTLIDTLYQTQSGRRFELGPIAGAGPNARVTIRPAVNTHVTIRGDSTAVLVFTNVKYLTLEGRSNPPSSSAGITVHAVYKPTVASNNCIEVLGDADYNQFLYLTIKSDDFRNVSPGGGTCVTLMGPGTSAVPDSNLIEGNLMSGVFGAYVTGYGTSPLTSPRGNIIRGNTYGLSTDLNGAWAIQSEICEGTLIEGNTVQYMRGTYLTTNNNRRWTIGINAYVNVNTTIRNNVVHAVYSSNGAEVYGILGSGGTDGSGIGLLMYNNMVYDLQNTSTTGRACIEGMCLWSNVNTQIFYNSVYLSGTGANPNGVDALAIGTSVTNTTLRNNIFLNFYHQTAGLTPTGLWANGNFTSDYNDLAVDTSFANSYTAHLGSTYYRTFSNWQGAGYDAHSVSVMPPFIAPDLHIANANTPIRDAATPIPGIQSDIDGNARPHIGHSAPDIGADEFDHVVSVDEEGGIPSSFSLWQNYPNPFNPATTIRYALPHTSFVTLTVYNTLGQQVAQLVNEQQQVGYHDVVFRGDGLASGVYFYRIQARLSSSSAGGQAGDFVASRKLLLLK